jgi:tripartite-type tricarboxylate transporter receptor subunit TctC
MSMKTIPMRRVRRNLCAALLGAAVLSAFAQGAGTPYPTQHVIRLVVGYAPGGPTDILARRIAPELAAALGQQVIVDNKAGASGNIGAREVVQARPDGYTLLMGDLTLATNPSLMRAMPFDPLKDLKAVAPLATAPLALVVHPGVPARTLGELIDHARANPDKLSNGTAGSGNLTHLAGEVLKTATGVKIQQVPYRGTGPALADLMGGQISMVITGLSSSASLIADGRVRPLAITGKARSPLLPEVPTFSEAMGRPLPELDLGSWWGLFAPAGTPDAIVAQIHGAVQKVLGQPAFRQRLAEMNIVADPGSPATMAARLKSEHDGWARVIRQAGIEPQ